jgi:hypothetical protein
MPVRIIDVGTVPAGHELRDAFVLFCRYTSGAWMRAIEAQAGDIAGVGLFVDDDIDALAADASVPLAYRLRLWRLHLAHRRRLARLCDILFVATPELAARHQHTQTHLLPAIWSEEDKSADERPPGQMRVAFHSTSVHAAEHRWLIPVMRAVLAAEPSMTFEVLAGAPLSWRWRCLPRTRIEPSKPWPRYRAESRMNGADLLLAPLLPTRANAARSWTKRIDALRLGAALLVSDPNVYHPDPEELSLGMCVEPEQAAWTTAIKELAADRTRLDRLRELNRLHVLRASAAAGPLLTDAMLGH